jgi:uncharacterized protein (DUF58 family)
MPQTAESYLRPEVIRQVARLDLKARFIVEGFLAGLHDSPYHGFSLEFSEHRKYVPGDDPALIDYAAWARTDRYYIRRFQAETNLACYLLVDQSASMDYASGERMTKLEYVVCLAAALGYLMTGQQDQVGLVTFDERVTRFVPPRSSRRQLTTLLSVLARRPEGRRTALADVLHQVAARVRKRSLVILFSDLLDDPDAVLKGLHHLRFRGHDLIVFHVLDEAEAHLSIRGPVELEDPETGERLTADPESVRADYLARLEALRDRFRGALEGARGDFVPVDTSMPFDKALVSFLLNRRKRF